MSSTVGSWRQGFDEISHYRSLQTTTHLLNSYSHLADTAARQIFTVLRSYSPLASTIPPLQVPTVQVLRWWGCLYGFTRMPYRECDPQAEPSPRFPICPTIAYLHRPVVMVRLESHQHPISQNQPDRELVVVVGLGYTITSGW